MRGTHFSLERQRTQMHMLRVCCRHYQCNTWLFSADRAVWRAARHGVAVSHITEHPGENMFGGRHMEADQRADNTRYCFLKMNMTTENIFSSEKHILKKERMMLVCNKKLRLLKENPKAFLVFSIFSLFIF